MFENLTERQSQDEKVVLKYDMLVVDPSTPWSKQKHIPEELCTAWITLEKGEEKGKCRTLDITRNELPSKWGLGHLGC